MLISEINPIDYRGVNLLNMDATTKYIDGIIELPLRNACKIFKQKGIETVMSSANKNNILSFGENSIEREEILQNEAPSTRFSYEVAGKGYAWIMLNFDTLSEENKNWLFELESRKNEKGESIGEKAIWFVHPYSLPKHLQKSEEFEKRRLLLTYHDGLYPKSSVFLRMPLNDKTTVDEVDNYFSQLAECFKSQIPEKKKEVPEDIEP